LSIVTVPCATNGPTARSNALDYLQSAVEKIEHEFSAGSDKLEISDRRAGNRDDVAIPSQIVILKKPPASLPKA
jgi:hypothetical protein